MEITEFISWGSLATYGGATIATGLLTQLFKPLTDKLAFRVPTRILAYVTALLILIASTAVAKGTLSDYFICLINAALVSLSASGGYECVKRVVPAESESEAEEIDGY